MAVDRNHGNEACRLHVARAAFDDMNGMRVPRGDIHCTAAEGTQISDVSFGLIPEAYSYDV